MDEATGIVMNIPRNSYACNMWRIMRYRGRTFVHLFIHQLNMVPQVLNASSMLVYVEDCV